MELLQITITQILIMCIIMAIGFVCYKINLLNKEKNKVLSDLLINIILPALIIVSFQRDMDGELLQKFLFSIILGVISMAVALILAQLLIRKSDKYDYVVARFAAAYSNCGFVGIPLAYGIFGAEGVLFIVGFNIIFNLSIFTHGVFSLQQDQKRIALRSFVTPAIMAIVIGGLLFALRLRLPEVLLEPLNLLSEANSPLGMLVAGASVAQTDLKSLVKNGRLYWASAIKLVIIPVAFIFICLPFGFPKDVLMVLTLATACPSATLGIIFAIRYGRDDKLISEIYSVSTILSIITIPLVMSLATYIFS